MRHCIARAILASLCTLLSLAFPARGHRRKCLTAQAQAPASAPAPEPVIPPSPWSRPWTSISKEEAAEIFRLQIENDQLALSAWELRIQWERRRAAALATMGIDHPYTYPDAPFDAESFRTRT
ncbi:hypothetical protein [Streptomyces acidiscabies]|uniref:Uncharacterized protein n=1 Tax=Streptomyces acidiscabies TaxID=42234 RepID=A0AAP6BJ79_9ACTN|nr:hypothetical protein [Streptomyces acidiscabies]MBP5938236.1 hypothetical protein [Streptomyces sp. LBUM 1476]MBZ3909256.1 hypothetical protein [Streptomyces acidiscabies]MDX2965693.1 hypothetical protein [Streptomyces acidiscabies]MDX3016338.1 hypothetical protein [Streptomyces acidiscabies]MDX3788756.1 hypothetical protein [Streptomyces acidiscabies]